MKLRLAMEVPFSWFRRDASNPWWNRVSGEVELPIALKDKRNIVLNAEEMREYATALVTLESAARAERERVSATLRALAAGRVPIYDTPPGIVHLAGVLEFQVKMAKVKLQLTELMVAFTKRAVAEQGDT